MIPHAISSKYSSVNLCLSTLQLLQFLSALHPLSGHFRDATLREGDLYCLVPISVIFAYDARMCNLSKWIDPRVESNPYLVIPCILRAAAKLSESLYVPKGQLSIRRKNPYPSEVMTSTVIESSLSSERSLIEVVRIPHLLDKPVESIILDLSPTRYYLDLIAKELGLCDAAKVFISRLVVLGARFLLHINVSMKTNSLSFFFFSLGLLVERPPKQGCTLRRLKRFYLI